MARSLARRGGISSRVLSGNSRAPTNPPTDDDDDDAEDRREGEGRISRSMET